MLFKEIIDVYLTMQTVAKILKYVGDGSMYNHGRLVE
jgi:hypothetical protein